VSTHPEETTGTPGPEPTTGTPEGDDGDATLEPGGPERSEEGRVVNINGEEVYLTVDELAQHAQRALGVEVGAEDKNTRLHQLEEENARLRQGEERDAWRELESLGQPTQSQATPSPEGGAAYPQTPMQPGSAPGYGYGAPGVDESQGEVDPQTAAYLYFDDRISNMEKMIRRQGYANTLRSQAEGLKGQKDFSLKQCMDTVKTYRQQGRIIDIDMAYHLLKGKAVNAPKAVATAKARQQRETEDAENRRTLAAPTVQGSGSAAPRVKRVYKRSEIASMSQPQYRQLLSDGYELDRQRGELVKK